MGGDQGGLPRLRYMQVVEIITQRIKSGEYAPGRRLPPEKDLAAELGVAYMTIRRAMEILRDRGLVRTLWGYGTYVREPRN